MKASSLFASSIVALVCLLARPVAAQSVAVVSLEDGVGYGVNAQRAYDTLVAAGVSADYFVLGPTSALPALDAYDQVWLCDFSAGPDTAPTISQGLTAIASWYGTHTHHAILDGRAISPLWPSTGHVPEVVFVRNYFHALDELGGGLVIATDHDAFAVGANALLTSLGFATFYGYYYQPPFRSVVDPTHSLWSRPEDAWQVCSTCTPTTAYVWDDSSTSNTPIGLQTNRQTLYPAAFHSPAGTVPSISITFHSAMPLTVAITVPAAATQYAAFGPGPVALGATATGGYGRLSYTWTTSAGTPLSSGASSSLPSTTPSPQTVTVLVRDADGRTATDVITIFAGACGADSDCPARRFCVDGACCNTRCGGGAIDCQACSMASGGSVDGTCGPLRADAAPSIECRAAVDACDQAEACSSADVVCPADDTAPDGTSCADLTLCDGDETCLAGACVAGTSVACDDGDPCTTEVCTEPTGTCETTVGDGCCNTDVDCDDADPCTTDTCSGAGGTCTHAPLAECCSEDRQCDDGDTCTDDACDTAASSCTHTTSTCVDAGLPDAAFDDAAFDDDAASTNDAGASADDAGVGRDAARSIDGSSTAPDGGTSTSSAGGCGCRAAGTSAPGTSWLAIGALGLALARRRSRRTR